MGSTTYLNNVRSYASITTFLCGMRQLEWGSVEPAPRWEVTKHKLLSPRDTYPSAVTIRVANNNYKYIAHFRRIPFRGERLRIYRFGVRHLVNDDSIADNYHMTVYEFQIGEAHTSTPKFVLRRLCFCRY